MRCEGAWAIQSQLATLWLTGPPHVFVHAWSVGAGGASRLQWHARGACREADCRGAPPLTALAPWQPVLWSAPQVWAPFMTQALLPGLHLHMRTTASTQYSGSSVWCSLQGVGCAGQRVRTPHLLQFCRCGQASDMHMLSFSSHAVLVRPVLPAGCAPLGGRTVCVYLHTHWAVLPLLHRGSAYLQIAQLCFAASKFWCPCPVDAVQMMT